MSFSRALIVFYLTLWFSNSKSRGKHFQYIKNLCWLGGSSLFSCCLGYHVPIPVRGHECQHFTQKLEAFGAELTGLPGTLLTQPVASAPVLISLSRQRCLSCPQHLSLLLCLDFVTSSLFRDLEPSLLLLLSFLLHLLNANNISNLTFKIQFRYYRLRDVFSNLCSYHFTSPWVRVRHSSKGIFHRRLYL